MEEKSVSSSEEFKLKTSNFTEHQSSVSKDLGTVGKVTEGKSNGNHQTAVCFHQHATVLKSEGATITPLRPLRRTSIMKLFDPLHSVHQTLRAENEEDYNNVLFSTDHKTEFSTGCEAFSSKEVINKTVTNIHMQQKSLISLESPKKLANPLIPKNLFIEDTQSLKKYSENEFHKILKAQELRLREEFSQKYSVHEKRFEEKDQILKRELSEIIKINKSYSLIASEISAAIEDIKMEKGKMEVKLEDLKVENEILKNDIKASKEDLGQMENAFSDVYKRYETSKTMIKSCKENEEHLRKHFESMLVALDEQNDKNEMLESRTRELTDQATKKIENAKKSAETEITILEAQLKKCQIKVSSLESDLQQAKSDNENLGSIYDDLMLKLKN